MDIRWFAKLKANRREKGDKMGNDIRIIRVKGLCHILVGEQLISKRGFLTRWGAEKYFLQHQDRNGFPVVEYKRKEWNGNKYD